MEPFVLSSSGRLCRVWSPRVGVALALAVSILLTMGGGAWAQSEGGWVAEVRGIGREPVPAGTSLAVVAGEFSDVNTRLTSTVEQALVNRGFHVDAQAPLQLSYTTQSTSRAAASGDGFADTREDQEYNLDAEDTASQPGQFDVVEPQVQVPIGHKGASSLSHYALDIIVGAAGETPLWTGGVTVDLPPRDPLAVAEAMVAILVPQIGQTMSARQAFPD